MAHRFKISITLLLVLIHSFYFIPSNIEQLTSAQFCYSIKIFATKFLSAKKLIPTGLCKSSCFTVITLHVIITTVWIARFSPIITHNNMPSYTPLGSSVLISYLVAKIILLFKCTIILSNYCH